MRPWTTLGLALLAAALISSGAALGAPGAQGASPLAQQGARWAADPAVGDCGICHHLPGHDPRDQGTIGPSLSGVGLRLDEDALRALLMDARALRPGTVMPTYGRPATGPRIPPTLQGKPLLPAHVREAIVAWLTTLGHG